MLIDNIEKFLHGAVRVWQEEGYFCFSRFTEKQDTVLDGRGYEIQKKCSTGMRIEFTTKSGEISFDYKGYRGVSTDIFGVDIVIDNLPVYNYSAEELPVENTFSYTITHSDTSRKVAVYLPNLSEIQIKNLNLPDDATPVVKDLKLLTLGDSITHGYLAKHQNLTYANILADELSAELVNQGIGGEIFCPDNLDEDLPYNPDIITVAYSWNDWARGVLFGEDMPKYLEKLDKIYHGKKIFILRPIYYKHELAVVDGHTLIESSLHIKECAERYSNMTVIDCHDFVPPLSDFYYDVIHPNDFGYIYYGHNLVKEIKKHLS